MTDVACESSPKLTMIEDRDVEVEDYEQIVESYGKLVVATHLIRFLGYYIQLV